MIKISVEKIKRVQMEIVERKGIGHPDTLCDLLAESLSLELSRYYLNHFGIILHHNVDKLLLVGGKSLARFGGGEIIEPIDLFYAGRAALQYKGEKIPLMEIIELSHENILKSRFKHLKKVHFKIHNHIRPGSQDLVELFERGYATGDFLSNDTSCGVGYAPLTTLEKKVLDIEQFLNSAEGKRLFPETGEDIKIMGTLKDGKMSITAGIAFIDRQLNDIQDYSRKKENIRKYILNRYTPFAEGTETSDFQINAADNLKDESIFMTVSGTSAESGDDGEVGRGNRANGLISPYFHMTMEAVCGKNPVTHTGKLYNWIAMEIAEEISKIPGISRCTCYLVSQIGSPVYKPNFVNLVLETENGALSDTLSIIVRQIIDEKLSSLRHFGQRVVTENLLLVR